MRTEHEQPVPPGVVNDVPALGYYINKYWAPRGRRFDFSQNGPSNGAAIQNGLPILSEEFNIHSQYIPIEQIPLALKQGPVIVSVGHGTIGHAELIVGMDKDKQGNAIPGSYRVYNPLHSTPQDASLYDFQITRGKNGVPIVFALRPYRKGEAHQKDF